MNLFEDIANALRPQPWKPNPVDVQVATDLKKALRKRALDRAIATIQYPHDGPLTPYVCIHRAITASWDARDQGDVDDIDAISEALEQVLTDQGWLSEGQETGTG